MQGMEKPAFPVIGNMRVDRIRRYDILRILKPVWSVHPDVARNLVGVNVREALAPDSGEDAFIGNPVATEVASITP